MSKYNESEILKTVLNEVKKGKEIVCFDLETTGLNKRIDRILSFSAIKAKWNKEFVETARMDLFINPGFHIPEKTSEINHITDEMVKDCDDENTAIPKIKEFIGDAILCGYNSSTFDIPMLNNAYLRVFGEELKYENAIDVFKLAKEFYKYKEYKLEFVAHELGCDMGLLFHRSMDDVVATLRVLNMIVQEDKKENGYKRLRVYGGRIFKKSYQVNRIYINTTPYTKTYYDIFRGEWVSDMDNVNMKQLQEDVFRYFNVSNVKELEKTVKAGG